MKNFAQVLLLTLAPLYSTAFLHGFEPYNLIEALIAKDSLPRVLNSTDIDLNPNDPQPLFSPMGDFNGDGIPDMAISGIYGLPQKNRYFLLVGTQHSNPVRYQKLFFAEYDKPIFLHKPGTTGEKDPGDQAFAVTFCSGCTDGLDFTWDSEKKSFNQTSWEKRFRRFESLPRIPENEEVPPETVDKALQIVGDLTDVKVFVAGIKKAKKQLGTRVMRTGTPEQRTDSQVTVQIFERKKKGETLYDELIVDVVGGKILKRKRR